MSSSKARVVLASLVHWLYPSLCVACARQVPPYQRICDACLADAPRVVEPVCIKCGKPLLFLDVTPDFRGICPVCLDRSLAFDAARAWALYHPPVDRWLAGMKYRGDARLADRLGAWLAQAEDLPQWDWTAVDGVTYVPLHPRRQRQRQYNQAERLARAVARVRGLPLLNTLKRVVYERAQVGQRRAVRWAQVAQAFRVRPAADIRGRSLLLVDDVHTTGATLSACAAALKKAGARHVLALTVATTPLGQEMAAPDLRT